MGHGGPAVIMLSRMQVSRCCCVGVGDVEPPGEGCDENSYTDSFDSLDPTWSQYDQGAIAQVGGGVVYHDFTATLVSGLVRCCKHLRDDSLNEWEYRLRNSDASYSYLSIGTVGAPFNVTATAQLYPDLEPARYELLIENTDRYKVFQTPVPNDLIRIQMDPNGAANAYTARLFVNNIEIAQHATPITYLLTNDFPVTLFGEGIASQRWEADDYRFQET